MSFLLSRKNRRCFGGTLVGLLLVLQLSAVVFPAVAVRKAVSKLKKPVRSIAKKNKLKSTKEHEEARKRASKVLRRGTPSFRGTSKRRAS